MADRIASSSSSQLPRVSVVIVNWNRLNDVLTNLKHLRKAFYPDLEVIVVDNGSAIEDVTRLSEVEDIRLICLPRNEGPSHARNVGLDVATGKYVLLLDSDAFLDKRCLSGVVQQMEREPEVAVAGFKVVNDYTGDIDQWIYAESYATHGSRRFDTYSFSAAGALIRKSAIAEVGGFWESLFIYNEEVELSIRLLRAGHRITFEPGGRVYHRSCPDGRASRATFFRHQIRNWIWIFYRHYPLPLCWLYVSFYSAMYLVKGLVNRQLFACSRGILQGLRHRRVAAALGTKMSFHQARGIAALNRRMRVRLWEVAPSKSATMNTENAPVVTAWAE